jgi:hypothetical protein
MEREEDVSTTYKKKCSPQETPLPTKDGPMPLYLIVFNGQAKKKKKRGKEVQSQQSFSPNNSDKTIEGVAIIHSRYNCTFSLNWPV